MTSPIHFDTNLVVDFFKGVIPREKFEPLLKQNVVLISVLVEYELNLGIRLSQNQRVKQLLTDFLDSIIIIPLSSEIVTRASDIQSQQISSGKKLPLIDVLIGTTAIVYNAKLLSNDKDMQKLIPYGLEVVTF